VALEPSGQVGGEVGENAALRGRGHEVAKSCERHAARPTLIHERRDPRVHAAQIGIEPEATGDVLVDMRVRVDQTRQHEPARAIDHSGAHTRQIRADGLDVIIDDEHIAVRIEAGSRVDDSAAFQ
jgi:hypothetical protein